ncbi:hypothetical protein E2C01_073484 [Portunus trituberculatus]|uniref:Uncharacterized protein n=1 Tax=Portunus trituberculatus TaxID=210409 RepID=A0A5B7IE20_PORTR|nr:hypothetical protein [Portunus trituberculatus]
MPGCMASIVRSVSGLALRASYPLSRYLNCYRKHFPLKNGATILTYGPCVVESAGNSLSATTGSDDTTGSLCFGESVTLRLAALCRRRSLVPALIGHQV